MKKLILTGLILALAIGLFAADGVKGYVKWIHTGTPISGARMSAWYHDSTYNCDYFLGGYPYSAVNGYYFVSFNYDPTDDGYYYVKCELPDGRIAIKQFTYTGGYDPTVNFFIYPVNNN